MDKELFAKLFSDECFRHFCSMIDKFREVDYKIELPYETAFWLMEAKVDCVKGNDGIEMVHKAVKDFLNSNGQISKLTLFYDYFVITNIILIAKGNVERIKDKCFRRIPLDFTEYANSICDFAPCTCNHKPKILFSYSIDTPIVRVICEKCELSVSILFRHPADFIHDDWSYVFLGLENGIRNLCELWDKEIAKNESIQYRTMKKLLSYGSNVCVDPVINELHKKLYNYVRENNIYRKPKYWNESGYWDIVTDKMMECAEPVKWVEDYLWENHPCKIGV